MENQGKDQLNEVKQEFINWRENRPGKKGATPEELKSKVIKLLETYTMTQVSKELSVYPKQLKNWQNSLHNSSESPNYQETQINFLETNPQELIQSQSEPLALSTLEKPLSTNTKKQTHLCSVVIERTDGNKLIAQVPLNTENLDILFSFIKA
jgi:hypothetical protein